MHNRPATHEPIPDLDMAIAVPCHRRDHVSQANAEMLGNRTRQHPGAAIEIAIGIAMNRAFNGAGNDFARSMPACGVIKDRVHQQRPILHQTTHAAANLKPVSRVGS